MPPLLKKVACMKFTISIRWALITGFLGLIWGTHLITTTSSYITSQEVLRRHARDIMQNIAQLAMEQSHNHLFHAQSAAALTRQLLASNVVSNQSNQVGALERYLHEQLSINPHLAGIYIGTPNGDFYDVRHFDSNGQGGYRTKLILNTTQGRRVRQIYRDDQFSTLSEETNISDPYDPRKRPWYKKATVENRIVWTDPYIFYTSQKPGITIAGPFFGPSGELKGVVGVDIEIEQLSIFIGNLKIGKHGRAFMLNNNADVVAFGEMDKLIINETGESGRARMAKIYEIDDAYSRKAFEAAAIETDASGMLIMNESRYATFSHEGSVYHAMFTPFTMSKWPWIIGVYLPEDDYLGAIKANRLNNIFVTMGISLLGAIMGIFLARGATRPISQLGRMAGRIKKNQTTPLPKIHSVYTEIQETADAFSEMGIAVEKSKKKYQGIFNNIQDVYYETSLNGTIIEISPSIERISSYRRKSLIGTNLKKIYADHSQRDRFIQALLNKGNVYDYEVLFKDKDGTESYCSLHSKLIKTPSGKPYRIIGSLRDITDRKLAEQALLDHQDQLQTAIEERTLELQRANDGLVAQIERRRTTENQLRVSEKKYRTILDTIEEAYFEIDLNATIMFVNDAACTIMGYTTEELTGIHFRHFSEHRHTREIIQTFSAMVRHGKPVANINHRVITKTGDTKVLELSATLTHDPSGIVTGFRGLAHDITSRITAQKEKENLQKQLNHAQRMEAVGTLAGGIAHDFNNLLMGITGNVSLISMSIDKNSPQIDYLNAIDECVESGASLTRQLLGYARGGKYQVTDVNLNDTVKRTSNLFGRTNKQIEIQSRYQKNIWSVKADQSQIDQVLINLYVNAWQAMTDEMTLILATENVILDEKTTAPFNVRPGPYVAVRVQDLGTGIEPKIIKRIFEPFFTTKKMGRGTGMGLASAFGIMKNHEGFIDMKSEVGSGTIFTIYLPAIQQPAESKSHADCAVFPQKASATLLVVDDESFILEALTDILKELGYKSILAENGRRAISQFEKYHDQIDGVLLDMIMPDMDGIQVMDALRKIRPGIKVILTSGYSLEGLDENSRGSEGDGFIQKPYKIKKLATVLNEVIGNPGEEA